MSWLISIGDRLLTPSHCAHRGREASDPRDKQSSHAKSFGRPGRVESRRGRGFAPVRRFEDLALSGRKGAEVEAHEIAEKIHEEEEPHAHTPEAFRRLTAIYVGVVAMLLAIASLGGGNATKEMLAANIHASDTYNFYQAKYIRQLQYET